MITYATITLTFAGYILLRELAPHMRPISPWRSAWGGHLPAL